MLFFLVLAVYMILFILAKWNTYTITGHLVLYGNASHEQERKRLLE